MFAFQMISRLKFRHEKFGQWKFPAFRAWIPISSLLVEIAAVLLRVSFKLQRIFKPRHALGTCVNTDTVDCFKKFDNCNFVVVCLLVCLQFVGGCECFQACLAKTKNFSNKTNRRRFKSLFLPQMRSWSFDAMSWDCVTFININNFIISKIVINYQIWACFWGWKVWVVRYGVMVVNRALR